MYFNYTKYIPIVFQLQNTNYFCQSHKKYKIQNALNVFKIHVFHLLVFQLLQHRCSHLGKFSCYGKNSLQSNDIR